ncbi:MAG: GGDEF domain-containing protein [Terriglobia bacterium]
MAQDKSSIRNRSTSGVRQELLSLEGRDYQLWSIVILIVLVLGAGFAALVLPELFWAQQLVSVDRRLLPQLIFGFITLIILFNIYVIGQRRLLRRTRVTLYRQLARAEKAEEQTFLDPLTSVFNRRYMDFIIPREVKRADRTGSIFTLLMVDIKDFKDVNDRAGHTEGDRFLQEVARVLRRTFRQSDTISRYGGDEFIIVLPDTDEESAQLAVDRLLAQAAAWNLAHKSARHAMVLSCGLAGYRKGKEINRIIDLADRRMYSHKSQQAASGATGRNSTAKPLPG